MKKTAMLFLSFLLYTTNSYASNEPSFACDTADLVTEKVICGSRELSALDRKLNELYQAELSKPYVDQNKLQSDQIDWLSLRNKCEYGYDCIRGKIKQRISILDTKHVQAYSWGGKLRAAPSMDSIQVGSIFGKQNIVIIEKTNHVMNGYPWFFIEASNQQAFQWGGLLCDPNQPAASYCLENK
ncbi:lysozyme inhibitor LprI family protein [Curvivirga sp.]|uniref:lysozyme inhibitor LprI family protein n=1 Tax=Curvivirga sp. TaxID=2856848 RepID=UPI003B58C1B5